MLQNRIMSSAVQYYFVFYYDEGIINKFEKNSDTSIHVKYDGKIPTSAGLEPANFCSTHTPLTLSGI